MRATTTPRLVAALLLSLIAAPLAGAAPATASPHGYGYEREWAAASGTEEVDAMAVSPQGDVFVAGGDLKIRRYDLNGRLTLSWELPTIRGHAEAMAVAPNGDVHVADWGNVAASLDGRVTVYSRDGAVKRSYAAPGITNRPTGIAIAADGTAYVSNYPSSTVARFGPDGAHLGSFGSAGTGPGQFDEPGGLALATDGTLVVTDTGNDRVQRFTTSGTFLTMWGQTGDAPGQFVTPRLAAATPSGTVLIASSFTAPVQEFRPDGSFVRSFGAERLSFNYALAVDRYGAVYVGGKLDSLVRGIAKFVPQTRTTAPTTTKQTYGKKAKLSVTVSPAATGTVRAKVGKKTVTAPVTAGKATLTLPKKALKPGTRAVTVTYPGVVGRFGASSARATVKVTKAKAKVKVKVLAKSVRRGTSTTVRVKVTAPGLEPGGKVTVKAKGAKTRTVRLTSKGVAKVRLAFSPGAKLGKRTVTVTYRGTKLVKKAVVKKAKITVRR